MRQYFEILLDHLVSIREKVVIDADVHISDTSQLPTWSRKIAENTDNYYHGKAMNCNEMLRDMETANIDCSLCWQNPAATDYREGDFEHNFNELIRANSYVFDCFKKHPTQIIPAGWTDPKALGIERAKKLIDFFIENDIFIIKMNPAQNKFDIAGDMVKDVTRYIVSKGAVPAFHYGADTPYTSAEGLEALAVEIMPCPIIGVHAGGGGAGFCEAEAHYNKTREMAKRVDNLYLIESAKRERHIESDIIDFTQAGKQVWGKIFMGSDSPYCNPSWVYAGARAMFNDILCGKNSDKRLLKKSVTDEIVCGFLGINFADFLISRMKERF